jgi:hypothetical protein
MLRLEPCAHLDAVFASWQHDGDWRRRPKLDGYHCTLLFVGRDLHPEIGEQMLRVGRTLVPPTALFLTGELMMFGASHDTLVAMLRCTDALRVLRQTAAMELPRQTQGRYNPHVALGIGRAGDRRPPVGPPRDHAIQVMGVDVKIGEEIVKL